MKETFSGSTAGTIASRKAWFDVAGPEGCPPIVFVHGSTLTRKSWQLQLAALCEHYRLIAPDLPGHGALAQVPFTFSEAVERLREVVEREVSGQALVVGISLGGHVATVFAHRYPQYVAGLLISGASMDFHGPTGIWVRIAAFLMLKVFKEQQLIKSAEKSIRKKWPADIAAAQIAAGIYPRGAAQSFLELPGQNFKDMLAGISAPVLILNGEYDKPNRRGEQAFLSAAQNARLAIVENANHACSLEQPEAYTRNLLDFAQTIGWVTNV